MSTPRWKELMMRKLKRKDSGGSDEGWTRNLDVVDDADVQRLFAQTFVHRRLPDQLREEMWDDVSRYRRNKELLDTRSYVAKHRTAFIVGTGVAVAVCAVAIGTHGAMNDRARRGQQHIGL